MVRIIVVEHKDRFTRFGFTGYKTLLNTDGRDIEVVNRGGKWQGRPAAGSGIHHYLLLCQTLRSETLQKENEKIIQELTAGKIMSVDGQDV